MISVGTIQSYLGISGQDAYLTILEASAVGDVERLSGLYLGTSKPFEDVRDLALTGSYLTEPEGGRRAQRIRLSQPVAPLSSITISERASPRVAWTEVAKTQDGLDVFHLSAVVLTRMIGAWPEGEQTVKATYSWGYATDNAPAGATGVVLDLIAARYMPPEIRALGGRVVEATVRGASVLLANGSPNTGALSKSSGAVPPEIEARAKALRPAGSW